jgi:hypothetical protein
MEDGYFCDQEHVLELVQILNEKSAKVTALESKVASLTALLEMVANIEEPNKQAKAVAKAKSNAKMEFYHKFKDDDRVKVQVELFKKTFPLITKPPWQFRKAVTDLLFKEKENEAV